MRVSWQFSFSLWVFVVVGFWGGDDSLQCSMGFVNAESLQHSFCRWQTSLLVEGLCGEVLGV